MYIAKFRKFNKKGEYIFVLIQIQLLIKVCYNLQMCYYYTQQKKKRHYVSLSNTFKPLILK